MNIHKKGNKKLYKIYLSFTEKQYESMGFKSKNYIQSPDFHTHARARAHARTRAHTN